MATKILELATKLEPKLLFSLCGNQTWAVSGQMATKEKLTWRVDHKSE